MTVYTLAQLKFTSNGAGNSGLTFRSCPQGQFVCGIGLGHDSGDSQYWTGARVVLTCCAL